jgi:purine nucleosidase
MAAVSLAMGEGNRPAAGEVPAPLPVVHDCDNALGVPFSDVDDGLALLHLLGAGPGIELLAVTTCFGNAPRRLVDRATRRLLDRAGRPGFPLHAGADGPGTAPTAAARRLVELAAARPGRVAIAATGPLTNLAAAAALDPGFLARVGRIVCLGGTLGAARLGWRSINEVNFGADPAAAAAVLAAPCPVAVVPTTSCLEARFGAADLARLDGLGLPVRRAVARWLACCRVGRGLDHFVLWDALAVVLLTRPDLLLTRRATVRLGPGARLALAEGDGGAGRHEVVIGPRDAASFKRAFLDGVAAAAAAAPAAADGQAM